MRLLVVLLVLALPFAAAYAADGDAEALVDFLTLAIAPEGEDGQTLIEVGKAEVVQNFTNNGKPRVALFGLGNMNSVARKAAAQLVTEGYDCAVINPRFTKPLDAGTHEFFGRGADVIVTLEDHVVMGGYGSVVLELFSEQDITTPVLRIGWPDQFIEHATTQDELRRKYGLTAENAVARVKSLFAEAAVPVKVVDLA